MNPQIGQIWRYVDRSMNLDLYCFLVKEVSNKAIYDGDKVFVCLIIGTDNTKQEAYFTKYSIKNWTWIS